MKKTLSLIVIALICAGIICAATLYLIDNQAKPLDSKQSVETESSTNEDENDKPEENKNRYEGLKLVQNTKGIPVLCYHSVRVAPANANANLKSLYVTPENFDKQMKYLKDNGYFTMTMDEFYNYYKDGGNIPEKSVLITFDDGYTDNYTNALPVLKKYGLNATVFMISGSIGKEGYMTEDQLKELETSGFEVQSHTVSHSRLSELSYEVQVKELKDSKASLEKLLNKSIEYIAYPESKFNKETYKACEETGYKLGYNLEGGAGDSTDKPFNIDRTYVGGDYDMERFKGKLATP